ncbi:hypothetical protein Hanom_Chr06g00574591 [Helianthus anomalus]
MVYNLYLCPLGVPLFIVFLWMLMGVAILGFGMRRGILDIVIRFNAIGQQWYLYLVYFEDNSDLICMPFSSRSLLEH